MDEIKKKRRLIERMLEMGLTVAPEDLAQLEREEAELNNSPELKAAADQEVLKPWIKKWAPRFARLGDRLSLPHRIVIDVVPNEVARYAIVDLDADINTVEFADADIPAKKKPAKGKEIGTGQSVDIHPDSTTEGRLTRKTLFITTPDGEEWAEKFAYQTVIKFIETVGEEIVAELDLRNAAGEPLVSQERISEHYKPTQNGWYVYSRTTMSTKAKQVRKISKLLGLNYTAKVSKR